MQPTVIPLPSPSTNTRHQMAQAKDDLESGIHFLRTAFNALTGEALASEDALDASMLTRKEAISKAADKATQAARTTMQVLEELRNTGGVSHRQFDDASYPWVVSAECSWVPADMPCRGPVPPRSMRSSFVF